MAYQKGQGASEYIVMLAVALVVVMVVASIVAYFPAISGEALQSQYDAYWQQARPFSVSGQQGGASTNTTTLVLENHQSSEITINSITLTSPKGQEIYYSVPMTVAAGGKAVVPFDPSDNVTSCEGRAGNVNVYTVLISYSDGEYTKTQSGAKPIALMCQQ
jgi:hypothetical protein